MHFSELERVSRIGSGSGGTVYKVIHWPTGRVYALKVIYGNHNEVAHRQTCREIKILRDMDNPTVVKCHEIGDHDGEIQVLPEFMDGGSLGGIHVGNESHLSHLSHRILSGVAYLRRRKIIHHDIKPSNLLVNSSKGRDRRLRREPLLLYYGPQLLGQHHRLHEPQAHHHRPQPRQLQRLCRRHLELQRQHPPVLPRSLTLHSQPPGRLGQPHERHCMSDPPEAPASASQEFSPARRWAANWLLRHRLILTYSQGPHHQVPSPFSLSRVCLVTILFGVISTYKWFILFCLLDDFLSI
ncbi:hypothetical protein ACJRO7_025806 [Eucalyptus globulus]|uniref:mitogen-activated protein kinase kinase n=1 Tax=Eucalyptus globulus TaxID=34317 RepID=A0ABD3KBA4_EUCGL